MDVKLVALNFITYLDINKFHQMKNEKYKFKIINHNKKQTFYVISITHFYM